MSTVAASPEPNTPRSAITTWLASLTDIEGTFKAMDTNGDGQLTAAEMHTSMSKLGISPEFCDGLLAMADVDGDGLVSLVEFIALGRTLRELGQLQAQLGLTPPPLETTPHGATPRVSEGFKAYTYAPDRKGSHLGSGAFAEVYRMQHDFDGGMYAVKLFRRDNTYWTWDEVRDEAAKMATLNHRHIVRYYTGFMVTEDHGDEDYGQFRCAMVTELCTGGTLYSIIARGREKYKEPVNLRRLTQLGAALNYLHNKAGVVHLDIKSNNVLISSHDNIKVADVGLSQMLENVTSETKGGARLYRAPEFGRGSPKPAYDLWSLGCLLSEMLTGQFIQRRVNDFDVRLFAPGEPDVVKWTADESISANKLLGNVVQRLLDPDPRTRMTSKELHDHLKTVNARQALKGERSRAELENSALRARVANLEGRMKYVQGVLQNAADAKEDVPLAAVQTTLNGLGDV